MDIELLKEGYKKKDYSYTSEVNPNYFVITNKGTDTSDKAQLEADSLIGLNNKNNKYIQDRIAENEREVRRIKSINPNAIVDIIGHSLAGTVVLKSALNKYLNENVNEFRAYNPGTNPIANYYSGDNIGKAKVKVHRVKGDVISQGELPKNVILTEYKPKLNLSGIGGFFGKAIQTNISHGLNNFQ